MTQEDRELLLKDLCARLPYKVICKIHYTFNNETTFGEDVEDEADCSLVRIDVQTQTLYLDWIYDWFCIEDVKPYLRPMSSMTDKEKLFLVDFLLNNPEKSILTKGLFIQDYLNKHFLDYRGLIERGLALETLDGIYK